MALLTVAAAACGSKAASSGATAGGTNPTAGSTSTSKPPSTTEEDALGGAGAPTVSGPVVASGAGSRPGGPACRPGDPLADVYHPDRLRVLSPCTTVTGVVRSLRAEADGDVHFDLQLDPAYTHLLTPANYSVQHGWLVAEIVPADEPGCTPGQAPRPPTGTYDYGTCTGADESPPAVGSHVAVTGPYVLDEDHGGWAEIHPVWAVSGAAAAGAAPASPASTAPPPSTASPATTTAPSPSGSCTASVSNPTPGQGGEETVTVTSDLPNTSGTVTAHYKTTNHPFPIGTDASGRGQVTFSIGHPTAGFTVRVDVDLSGRAACSTSFTPQ